MPYSPTTWVDGVTKLGPTNLNKIETELARLKANADLDPAAAIAYSKLALTGAILNADLAGSIAYSKLILSASVVNADIATAAAIAYSKLALTGSVVNADVATAAAIALSKLADPGSGKVVTSKGAGAIADFPPGFLLSYVEFTGNVTSASTTFAAGASVVSAGPLTFDGSTKIRVEFFSPAASTTANNAVISLADGGAAGTDLGWMAVVGTTLNVPVHAVREFTPPAATKTYSAIIWVTAAATGTVTGGAGGAGVRFPGFIRISKVS